MTLEKAQRNNTSVMLPGGSEVKSLPVSAGDTADVGLIPGLGRFPGGGNGNLLQYSSRENSMDKGAWWATFPGLTKTLTQLKQKLRPPPR